MYILIYTVDGIKTLAKNTDVKVLRNIINLLDKKEEWSLYNDGGICLDSSRERGGYGKTKNAF